MFPVVLDEAEPRAQLTDDIVPRDLAKLVGGSHCLDGRDQPVQPLAPSGIRPEIGQAGCSPCLRLQPSNREFAHAIA
jgi:hypothetical protein